MRFNNLNVRKLYARERQQVHVDGDVELTHNCKVVFLEQEVVWQDASRDGILDGHHRVVGFVVLEAFADLMESEAFDRFDGLPEVCEGSNLVEAGRDALDGDSCLFGFGHSASSYSIP